MSARHSAMKRGDQPLGIVSHMPPETEKFFADMPERIQKQKSGGISGETVSKTAAEVASEKTIHLWVGDFKSGHELKEYIGNSEYKRLYYNHANGYDDEPPEEYYSESEMFCEFVPDEDIDFEFYGAAGDMEPL